MVPSERVPAKIGLWYVQILEARPQKPQKIREPEQLSIIDGILAEQPSTIISAPENPNIRISVGFHEKIFFLKC